MTLLNTKKVHEKYHNKTSVQYKSIDDKNFTYRHILAAVNKYLTPGMKVLDIGCGAGTVDFYYAKKGYQVTGIDISNKAIESCQKTAINLGLRNLKFEVLNFPNEIPMGNYDFIIFSEVIEHLEDDTLALKKIHRLLKRGGILFLTTPSQKAPLHLLGMTNKFDKEVGHLRRYEVNVLSRLVEENGFGVVEIQKKEGIIRNFLFINPYAGKFVKFVKFFFSDLVTIIDNISLKIFGESNFFIVARKV